MNTVKIFNSLYSKYGSQGWWPLTIAKFPSVFSASKLLVLRKENGLLYGIPWKKLTQLKSSSYDPYFDIAVGSILTQNTAWKNVALTLQNLASNKFLTPKKIACANVLTLEKQIRSSGYYKQKTKKLKLFAEYIQKKYQGDLSLIFKQNLIKARQELLNIWGIGNETADSILLYAGNMPIFVIDTYTKRLCLQNKLQFKTYDEYQTFFMNDSAIPKQYTDKKTEYYKEFHALIVRWGKDSSQT